MPDLFNKVLDDIAAGHNHWQDAAHPPTPDQQRTMAEEELDHMSHTAFLHLLSLALDEMFPEEEADA